MPHFTLKVERNMFIVHRILCDVNSFSRKFLFYTTNKIFF